MFVFCLIIGIGVLTVGYEAYDRHQRRLLVFAAIDPEDPNVNLPELRTLRTLLEGQLQDLDKEIRIAAPDLEPGSLEVLVFSRSDLGLQTVYLALVRYHNQAIGFSVLDDPDLPTAARKAAFDIRVNVAFFLAFRRHQPQRPGQLTARALFYAK